MKHFWLGDDQQAIMDAATSSASDYGYIGLVDVGPRWKKPIRDLVGTDVADANQVRIYNAAKSVAFFDQGNWFKLKSAVRLTAKQAMMLKLRVAGSGTAFLCDDPTGESWGNICIAQTDRRTEQHKRFDSTSSWWCFQNMTNKLPFGPTLATVGESCKGMPSNWARAMIWSRAHSTHQFADDAEKPTLEQLKVRSKLLPRHKVVICPDIMDYPVVTYGQAIARAFTMDLQRYQLREKFGCDGDLGPIIE
jgi:hypothetical protein